MVIPKYIKTQIIPGLTFVIEVTIDDAGFKQLPIKLGRLKQFWKSPHAATAQTSIATSVQRYWNTHIYNYYHHGSGNLGNACHVRMLNGSLTVSMGKLYHIHKHMPGRGKAYSIWEYGKYIRDGTKASPGKYVPVLGVRVKTGSHPGVPTSRYWDPWMKDYKPAIRSIYRRKMLSTMKQFVEDVLESDKIRSSGQGWIDMGIRDQYFVTQATPRKRGSGGKK